jgi:hypothetical protein
MKIDNKKGVWRLLLPLVKRSFFLPSLSRYFVANKLPTVLQRVDSPVRQTKFRNEWLDFNENRQQKGVWRLLLPLVKRSFFLRSLSRYFVANKLPTVLQRVDSPVRQTKFRNEWLDFNENRQQKRRMTTSLTTGEEVVFPPFPVPLRCE